MRQTELGEHHPDFPSSMGDVVAYHGKGVSPGRRRTFQREGILPIDTEEAQVGSGRYVSSNYGKREPYWNKDIPASVSVTGGYSTAQDYAARGAARDRISDPVVYGVRAGALVNQLPMDDPRRLSADHEPEKGREAGGSKTHRFIAGGMTPESLVEMDYDDARLHSFGDANPFMRRELDEHGNWVEITEPKYESHGPEKIYREAIDQFDEPEPPRMLPPDPRNPHGVTDYSPEWLAWRDREGEAGFAAREQWIDDQVEAWRAQQAEQAAAQAELQRRKEEAEAMQQPDWDNQATLYDNFQTGEPMEIAMRLLKMPLMPETVKEVSPGNYEAQFYNPETDVTYPMRAWRNTPNPSLGTSQSMNVGIYPPDKTPSKNMLDDESLGMASFEASVQPDKLRPKVVHVEKPHRKQGMATAMYDMGSMISPETIVPSDQQSAGGAALWSNQDPSGWSPTVQTGEPMDIAMQLLKEDCYWCDKDLTSVGVRQNYLMNRGTHRFPPPCPECAAIMAEGPPDKLSISEVEQENPIFTTGEPMDLSWRLLKENNFFDNMRAKRKRGEKPAKPGDEDYPSKDQWKDITAKSKKPDPRLKAAGVSGYNKPKRTPKHPKKSHVVVARSGGKVKTIRFGEQGADTVTEDNPKGKRAKKRASFKARHRKNIKRGPMSAAYWADKVKW